MGFSSSAEAGFLSLVLRLTKYNRAKVFTNAPRHLLTKQSSIPQGPANKLVTEEQSALFLHACQFLVVPSLHVFALFLLIQVYQCAYTAMCLRKLSLQMMCFPHLSDLCDAASHWGGLTALLVESLARCFNSYSMQNMCCQRRLYNY